MIPFFWLGYLNLGFIQVAWFYVFVASAVLVGYLIGRWRARRVGLESGLLTQMALVSVLTGFAGSHGIAVLLEAPALVRKNPLMLLQLWRGMSSLGGIVSGLIGLAWVGWRRGLSWMDFLRYLDVVAYSFSCAWLVGRIGCFVTHDHLGPPTSFWLGISLATIEAREYVRHFYYRADVDFLPEHTAFHDLGFNELLYMALIVVPLMLLLGRRRWPPGVLSVAFVVLYTPFRIALDTLRVTDFRWFGMTVAQWLCSLLLIATLVLLSRQYGRQP